MNSASNSAFGDTPTITIVVPQAATADGATYVSKTIPDNTTENAGASFTQTWTMKNTGTSVWTSGTYGYTFNRVGSTVVLGESTYYVQLGSAVSPGGTATFSMQFTAPTTAGTYTEQWRMNSASNSAFGDTPTITIVVPQAATADGATYVSKTIPDNTTENAGASFTQTWTMKNTGTSVWTSGTYGYTFNRVGSTVVLGESTYYVQLGSAVSPGGTATFSMQFTAPTTAGTYTEQWRMNSASNSAFGDTPTITIVVPQAATADGATYVSKTIPDNTTENAGASFTQTWTMKNTGTSVWTSGTYGYTFNRVGSTVVLGESTYYVQLGSAVSPGGTATFSMQFTAPTTAGTYTEQWRMNSASNSAFGDTPTITIVVPQAATADGATYVSKTIPDNTTENAGASFTQTWTMKNTGTSVWTSGTYGYTFNRVGSTVVLGESTYYVQLGSAVSPGGTATFSMQFTAPTTLGRTPSNGG